MSKKHLAVIVNPHTGAKAIRKYKMFNSKLDKKQFSYEILHTEYPKHGIELARNAAGNGAHAVVAVGGDGSVNDVVSGLINTNTALAVIPKGSGNGMARTMEIPLKLDEKAIGVINRNNSIMMDVGFANGRPFISNAGVGFDALISKKFATSKKRGFAEYTAGWSQSICGCITNGIGK